MIKNHSFRQNLLVAVGIGPVFHQLSPLGALELWFGVSLLGINHDLEKIAMAPNLDALTGFVLVNPCR